VASGLRPVNFSVTANTEHIGWSEVKTVYSYDYVFSPLRDNADVIDVCFETF